MSQDIFDDLEVEYTFNKVYYLMPPEELLNKKVGVCWDQVELERNEQYSIFCFRIAPTYDFIQELRKHGATLEVLEPEYLREELRQESTRLGLLYSTEKKHP